VREAVSSVEGIAGFEEIEEGVHEVEFLI